MPLGQPRKKEDIFIRYISRSANGMVERRELQKLQMKMGVFILSLSIQNYGLEIKLGLK